MPGPRNINTKKKRKSSVKKDKKSKSWRESTSADTCSPTLSPLPPSTPPQPYSFHDIAETLDSVTDEFLPQVPYIHDPGNGPRVRDTRAFLSSYFAQPSSLDDPLCAEFAQEEVLQMLCTVLPEETALILWYNKSRSTGRICPACQRLYRLGDVLPNHLDDGYREGAEYNHKPLPQLEREQEISGLCSPVCFILASFSHPGAIKSTWGRSAREMSDATWDMLNTPGESNHGDLGLGMLLKMTRLDDLGLGQLCLPGVLLEEVELARE